MKVKAKAPGFYGGSIRNPGEVFEVPDGFSGSWFVRVVEVPAKTEKTARKAEKPQGEDLV